MVKKSKKRRESLSPDLVEYVRGTLKTSEIGHAHGLSQGAITARAKAAGLPLRRRGRWMKDEPTERQKRIIRLARKTTGVHAAAVFGVSKQRVSKLLKRWSHWMAEPTRGSKKVGATPDKQSRKHQTLKGKIRIPPKDHVISFRIDQKAFNRLGVQAVNPAFKGIKSENQIARKIVMVELSKSSYRK